MRHSVVETLIGALVILIAAGFFAYAYRSADVGRGSSGYRITAQFESIDGITRGSDVRMSGIKIGSVVEQRLDPESYEAVVVMIVDPTIKLPVDSSAKVTSEGLLGDKYIALEAGGDEELLKDGDMLEQTQGALDLWALVRQFMFSGDGSDKKSEGSEGSEAPDTSEAPQSSQEPNSQ